MKLFATILTIVFCVFSAIATANAEPPKAGVYKTDGWALRVSPRLSCGSSERVLLGKLSASIKSVTLVADKKVVVNHNETYLVSEVRDNRVKADKIYILGDGNESVVYSVELETTKDGGVELCYTRAHWRAGKLNCQDTVDLPLKKQ